MIYSDDNGVTWELGSTGIRPELVGNGYPREQPTFIYTHPDGFTASYTNDVGTTNTKLITTNSAAKELAYEL